MIENRIKSLRQEKNMSIRELADVFNTSNQNISNWENGKTEPKLAIWQKLADYFEVSVPYLQGTYTPKNRLREIRLAKKLSLNELQNELVHGGYLEALSATLLPRWERGEIDPKIETWLELADYFGVSVGYLQGITDNPDQSTGIGEDTRAMIEWQYYASSEVDSESSAIATSQTVQLSKLLEDPYHAGLPKSSPILEVDNELLDTLARFLVNFNESHLSPSYFDNDETHYVKAKYYQQVLKEAQWKLDDFSKREHNTSELTQKEIDFKTDAIEQYRSLKNKEKTDHD